MNIPKVLDKLDKQQNELIEEFNQIKIEFSKINAYSKTHQATLRDMVKQFEKLNKNLNKAGDDCACKPIGHDNQREEISQ